ncbi:TetR family transcriptional regulator [Streptomyces sp. SID8379]|uniref:TetR/AcrR family transcriptional regulator n=1 Tax=unclassified Streptomyces TaxID=2593676 RepID=UPI0003673D75|nr:MULTISPECIES: TetR/AcrR family transcriptional regulator [unclassified Streptomyces]MYW63129.1 TetR family transcriptional regulator [Streptomyces sp. SID8379]
MPASTSGPTPAPTGGGGRPARADARRNRDRLLAAALAAFTRDDTTVPLETIAREAGVGIGTLYRNFPTREALVEAVYSAELDAVTAAAETLLGELAPQVALRAWMDRYADLVTAKRAMAGTLSIAPAGGRGVTANTRERLTAAVGTILDAGAREGTLRDDVPADDVITMLLGVFLSTAAGDRQDRTRPLLDLVADALRPHGDGGPGSPPDPDA